LYGFSLFLLSDSKALDADVSIGVFSLAGLNGYLTIDFFCEASFSAKAFATASSLGFTQDPVNFA